MWQLIICLEYNCARVKQFNLCSKIFLGDQLCQSLGTNNLEGGCQEVQLYAISNVIQAARCVVLGHSSYIFCVIWWHSQLLRLYSVIHGWVNMEYWWNDTDRGKTVPMPLCSPPVPRRLAWDRTQASALRYCWLTACAMAWPHSSC